MRGPAMVFPAVRLLRDEKGNALVLTALFLLSLLLVVALVIDVGYLLYRRGDLQDAADAAVLAAAGEFAEVFQDSGDPENARTAAEEKLEEYLWLNIPGAMQDNVEFAACLSESLDWSVEGEELLWVTAETLLEEEVSLFFAPLLTVDKINIQVGAGARWTGDILALTP